MKILSIITPVEFGGGERLILDQAKIFQKRGIEYIVLNFVRSITFEKFLTEEKIKYFNLINKEFKQTPSKKDYLILFFRLLPFIWRIRMIIKKEKPDIILTHGFPALLLTPISLAGFHLKFNVFYVHHSIKSKEKSFVRKVYLYFLKKYEKVIAVSSCAQKSLIEIFPEIENYIINIPNGVNFDRFNIKESKEELRKKFKLPKGVLAINVARMAACKNQRFLIKIAKKINRDDFYILIIGDGEEYENLKKMVKDARLEKNIIFFGFIEPNLIPYYLKASDIFLFPSLGEGFGIAIIEAMAAGLPIVIFKDIYNDEFSKEVLVANTEEDFINYTKKLIEDDVLRNDLGAKLKEHVRKNLDIGVIIKKWRDLFDNTIKFNDTIKIEK